MCQGTVNNREPDIMAGTIITIKINKRKEPKSLSQGIPGVVLLELQPIAYFTSPTPLPFLYAKRTW